MCGVVHTKHYIKAEKYSIQWNVQLKTTMSRAKEIES